jgi:t-SNARE complex subunit (syntaxin)
VADEQVIKLLEEIRDLQKAHVASYKEAVKNQQEAIDLQKRAMRRQKITILVIVFVVVAFLLFVALAPHH